MHAVHPVPSTHARMQSHTHTSYYVSIGVDRINVIRRRRQRRRRLTPNSINDSGSGGGSSSRHQPLFNAPLFCHKIAEKYAVYIVYAMHVACFHLSSSGARAYRAPLGRVHSLACSRTHARMSQNMHKCRSSRWCARARAHLMRSWLRYVSSVHF